MIIEPIKIKKGSQDDKYNEMGYAAGESGQARESMSNNVPFARRNDWFLGWAKGYSQYKSWKSKDEEPEQTAYQDILITIENPVGSIRQGVSPDGTPWATLFYHPYGYIENTRGNDKEEIDCFIGPNPYAMNVYIIRQRKAPGRFDEDKVIFGCNSMEEARCLYLAHYDTQSLIGPIIMVSMPEFREMLHNHAGGRLRIDDA